MPKHHNNHALRKHPAAKERKTILLVDDDFRIHAAFTDVLPADKYRTLQAFSAGEALACLEQQTVDLIITDLALTHSSGLSLLIRLREKGRCIPVIVMSAYTDLLLPEEWKSMGAIDFISKPPDLAHLSRVISGILAPREVAASRALGHGGAT